MFEVYINLAYVFYNTDERKIYVLNYNLNLFHLFNLNLFIILQKT